MEVEQDGGFLSTNLGMIVIGVLAYIIISGIDYFNQLVFGYTIIGFRVLEFLGLGIAILGILSTIIDAVSKKQ